MKPNRLALSVLLILSLAATKAHSQAPPDSHLLFQTDHPWSPRTNINADTVMVYGIDDTTASRIKSWRDHGYHVTVMTGVAWGRYAPYLRGDFDGKEHWNETQQEKSGKLILHSGREVPYISPTISYGNYLAKGVEAALDAGAEAIYLEEPEFWARAGWSDAFKNEWQRYYHEPWQAPDASADAQYRASKLKYFLYQRALAQVFASVRIYAAANHRRIHCYVATHSLINYAQWQIVSPESSLLNVGADGYIAQVWTGTSRAVNTYQGVTKERTFETAFLEYGALQNIARSSGKPIWYLNDPIEDNPNHSWVDYRRNWESTLTASLLQPVVSRYEVLPWPDRIFGPKGFHLMSDDATEKSLIPRSYETELQTVFHALGHMDQPADAIHWESAGTQGIGILVSDTLMFQRAAPTPSDENLGNFYGLALPLIMRGMPVEPVQIESATSTTSSNFLKPYKILLLTYEGQKPPTPAFHTALAAWVRAGGALIVLDDDKDPYNLAHDWWNAAPNHFATPREHLFRTLGLSPNAEGLHRAGKGYVLFSAQSPTALAHSPSGPGTINILLQQAAKPIHLTLKQTNALVLRRGPYVIAAGLEDEAVTPVTVTGNLINLFDPNLAESPSLSIHPGTRALLLDTNQIKPSAPRVLVASAKITHEQSTPSSLTFDAEGIDSTEAVARIFSTSPVKEITLNGTPIASGQYQQSPQTLLLHFPNSATPQQIHIVYQ
ncbi:hypothetical protein [Granulicella sibirica]|uniref:Glycoside hydrolase family 42 N-terminal domain-containing protein n=1 Tax=Granulicella sibirica TaxID=2479048 RepID=A0A4Q0SYW9_9BACT|nr:hypothetical protein [Granulicella sibirica]RXH56425.1 hypothetical protein GRAN_3282 [Granulicella sibirica]